MLLGFVFVWVFVINDIKELLTIKRITSGLFPVEK